MWKYAVCNEMFEGWDWAATCHHVAELGYQGIEVAPFTLSEDVRTISSHARNVYRHTAERAGLEVVGLHWLLISPERLSLTSQDEAIRIRTTEYLIALVDCCADLGGRIMVLGSPKQRRIPEGDTGAVALSRLMHCLEPTLDRARAHDVTLCLEPLPPPEADLILTLQEAVGVVASINHPNLKTIFDVKSASSETLPMPELLHGFAPYIAHIHANDANRRGPGFGDTDFRPVLAALDEIGYTGWVSLEVFDYTPDPTTIARDSLAYLRQSAPPHSEGPS